MSIKAIAGLGCNLGASVLRFRVMLPAHASASASPLPPFDAAPKNERNSQTDYHQHTEDYERQIHGQRLSQSSADATSQRQV